MKYLKVLEMASNNNQRVPGMSFLPQGLNDFYKGWDAAITAPLQKTPPKPEETVTPPTPERTGPIAPTTRTNENGVTQTGRDLSGKLTFGDAVDYLRSSTKGYVQGFGNNTFSSNQLPATNANPFSGSAGSVSAIDGSEVSYTGNQSSNYGGDGGAAAASSTDQSKYTPMTGKEQRIKGASERPARGTLSEALADTAGINSYMDKFSSGNEELARRAAFLDAPDGLSGMKAVKAQQNMISVGGGDYFHNDGKLTEMNSGDMRERLAGRMSAEQLKDKYVTAITDSASDTPSQEQNPVVLDEPTTDNQPTGNKAVDLDTVNSYLDNGKADEYFSLLDSGKLTSR